MDERNIVSKTARIDEQLVEQALEVLQNESDTRWRQLNYSDAARYGLVMILAAFGKRYRPPGRHNTRRYDSAFRYKTSATLDAAIDKLLKDPP